MIKINYLNPKPEEIPDDIAIHNIKISDKFKKPDLLESSCMSWLNINKSRDYQELEQMLRFLQVDSHLVAQPITVIPEGFELDYLESEKDFINENNSSTKYLLKISCKPNNEAIKDVLNFHSSYEENFDCLRKTGFLVPKKNNSEQSSSTITSTNSNSNSNSNSDSNIEKGIDEIKKVSEAKTKLDITFYKTVESIGILIESLTSQYGRKPEQIPYGEIGGNKVVALVLDNKIISPIGWVQKIKKQKIEIEPEIISNSSSAEFEKLKEIYSQYGLLQDYDYELIDFRGMKIEK